MRKEAQHTHRYYDHHPHEAHTPAFLHNNNNNDDGPQQPTLAEPHREPDLSTDEDEREEPRRHLAEGHGSFEETVAHIMADSNLAEETDQFSSQADFIRITDDQ